MKLREAVEWFAGEMEKVLRDNDYKGGWENEDLLWLLDRIGIELKELEMALSSSRSETIKEAVDVANFAMMIADIANTQTTATTHKEG